jgi:hypothetical protein
MLHPRRAVLKTDGSGGFPNEGATKVFNWHPQASEMNTLGYSAISGEHLREDVHQNRRFTEGVHPIWLGTFAAFSVALVD